MRRTLAALALSAFLLAPGFASAQLGSDYYYHVVGFATVTVKAGDAQQGAGTIRACVEQVITGLGEPSPNAGFGHDVCRDYTMIVALWE